MILALKNNQGGSFRYETKAEDVALPDCCVTQRFPHGTCPQRPSIGFYLMIRGIQRI
jgi:hypothetical protein